MQWLGPHVCLLQTDRVAGYSEGTLGALNLATHVGDRAAHVHANRARLRRRWQWAHEPAWLTQIHSTIVVKAPLAEAAVEADAAWTDVPGQPVVVMTADCLPVVFFSEHRAVVGVAHAGWRGLLDGVLENTVNALGGDELYAWLGPCIGPQDFEIGAEVREQFVTHDPATERFFTQGIAIDKYLGDLHGIAAHRLANIGVDVCGRDVRSTLCDPALFSHRKDAGQSGRMATIAWISSP
ncbi:MAG: peptidoglycan editing factor PgeF [Gammaproteobacteria bacterium]|nr:peptidoglycan editing factor PgeF [Gammaproteobacteria bacterium]